MINYINWKWWFLLFVGDRFIVTRKLGFEDTRLIYLNVALKLCVLGYIVLWQICTMHQYAEFEPVSAYGNIWDGDLSNLTSSRQHCSNNSYDWGVDLTAEEKVLTGGYRGFNISCIPFDRSVHVIIDSDSFAAVTWETHEYSNGSVRYYFTDSPERAVMNMIHGFTSSFLQNGVINPRTAVSKKNGETYADFDDKMIFGPLSMSDVLRLSEVSLDARNLQPWLRGGDPSQSPFHRLSGVVVIVRIAYSNFRDYEFAGSPLSGRPMARATFEALPGAWGFLGRAERLDPVTLEPVSVSRNGVKLQLTLSGEFGRFNLVVLVRRALEGVVLFGMAYGTELVARRFLYRSSYDRITSDRLGREQLQSLRGSAGGVAPGGAVEPTRPAAAVQVAETRKGRPHDQDALSP